MSREITNTTTETLHVVGLGNLEPGKTTKISAEQEEEYEAKTGRKFGDLKAAPGLEVKGAKAKKEEDE